MTQKTTKMFINENYSKGAKKNYSTNKTDVYHNDDKWSLDILGLKDYGPESNRGYRYVLVITDNFSKFGCTKLLKNKNAQTIKDSFENNLMSSKGKQNLNETNRGKELFNNILQNFLNNNNVKHYSRNTSLAAVFPEPFKKAVRNLLKNLFLKKVMLIGLIFYLQ